jgi:uncharacterized protein YigA (DUF484 family)
MSETIAAAPGAARGEVRARILDDPGVVLEDPAVMRALMDRVRAGARSADGKVVDLRSVAMDRLEERLDRLEATHATVIAAAYDNLAGTQQVHRAILRLLDAQTLDAFAVALDAEVGPTLHLSAIELLVECDAGPGAAVGALRPAARGALGDRLAGLARGRVTLARVADGSEAALALDLGPDGPPALLLLGSDDPDHLAPGQGTELLEFLAGVVERTLRRWLE